MGLVRGVRSEEPPSSAEAVAAPAGGDLVQPLAPEVFVEVVAGAPEAKLVLDPRGRVLYANAQAERMVGALAAELVGQHVGLLVPTRLHERCADLARRWQADPRPVAMGEVEDAYLRLSDGSECPVDVSVTPVESAGLPLVAVSLRDTRAQRLAGGRFQEMLESAPDGMLVVDAEGRIDFGNARACEMLRCAPDELVGSAVDRFVPEASRAGHAERRRQFLAEGRARPMSGQPGGRQQLFAERADGTHFPADISLSMVSSEEGQRVVVAVRDASERLALHTEAQRMRDELVSTVSHELRTPLASIIGYTELLAELGEEHLSATARQMLDVIARNAAREQKLVNDLLSASYERLGDRLELAAVDLRSVVAGAAQQAAAAAVAAGVAVEVEPQEERIAVLADPERVREMVEHLLDNALKFTHDGGRVGVAVWYEGRDAVIHVGDDGVGMTEEEVALACERLYRAPVAVEGQLRGSGLGLTLVRDIVEAHGGFISIDSAPGRGTAITVTLPVGGP